MIGVHRYSSSLGRSAINVFPSSVNLLYLFIMKQHKIIQYSKMTFSCTVVRKHFFKDKVYYLYVLDQSFIMVDVIFQSFILSRLNTGRTQNMRYHMTYAPLLSGSSRKTPSPGSQSSTRTMTRISMGILNKYPS